ncbi:MAG: RNA 2'-phosphotransferase [Planctomycetes bacterium]|nr:RNA 2'-phosphotransferase [Planctomycetota bacterium]
MNAQEAKRISKFLSYVLRHDPGSIGVELSPAGWVPVETLIAAANRHGSPLTVEQLHEVVRTSDKQRFALSEDGLQIRANQGHSVSVELGYEPAVPPELLYHGTTAKFLDAIRREGLKKGRRHHVHLSATIETATAVGGRRGKPVILAVRAAEMHRAGAPFYVTPNKVWLTDAVPIGYIDFPKLR